MPGAMEWEPMEGGYGSWLAWTLSDTPGRLRGPAMARLEAETAALNPRQGPSVIPFLRFREARGDLAATGRRPAAMRELMSLRHELRRQLTADPDPGFLRTIARPAGKPA
jgi:hypothetical protein